MNDRLFYTRGPGMPGPYKATEEIHYAFNRRTRQIIRHRLAAVFCAGAGKAVFCGIGRLCDGGCGGKDRLPQDPYHEPGQAMGLSFSVPDGCKAPPSLRNIFKELESEFGPGCAAHTDLTPWAQQGVLLLNTVLTVEQGAANAHASHGWETFTRAALEYAAAAGTAPLAAVLWGKPAQKYAAIFEKAAARRPVLVLESAHPSPLSAYRGFFGSAPFGKVNAFLENNGVSKIDWYLPANATHS